jgi:transketolase
MARELGELKNKANWIRKEVLEAVARTGKGHLGGTFSCTDILTALYYGGILRFDAKNPKWPNRDRLIIGKGHACLALYNILVDLGFFDKSRLEEYGSNGSSLGGQLNIDTPGVEYNTGSLGHALGVGAGMALSAKMDNKNYKTFVLIGDGECDEGSIWESIMFISQKKLNNLIGIIDRNRLSVTDIIEEDDGSGRLEDKLTACGWKCLVINGHSFEEIINAMSNLENLEKPLMIIADTIKGKGVSFMENGIKWHHSVPTKEELEIARKELQNI